MNNDLLYQIALTLVPGIGDVLGKKLITYCGSAEAVFQEKKTLLKKIPRIGEFIASSVVQSNCFERAEQEINFIEKFQIQPICFTDEKYPKRLKECNDAPVLLYYKGTADLNHKKFLAVVGTRMPSDYGKNMCENIVREMNDVLIISGLAYGIDSISHRTAVEGGLYTIGVLGHGLDTIYPSTNRVLAEKMLQRGGLLTEYISKTIPERENFPRRNRIVAGMADAVLVIESGIKGGSLITANIANSYNRDVFALPGKTIDSKSAGCNYLIRTNKAALVENAEQIKEWMQWNDTLKKEPPIQRKLFLNLTPDETLLMNILEESGTCSIDHLINHSKLSPSRASAALLNMEFEGILKSLPGKMYCLL
ncbi:MAG: DNA-processing protein DprA [Bacteroidales bacterium]|nr:DNA-processing protein DprA [Bacteroidales bacterium]